jgi:hypothetical protein
MEITIYRITIGILIVLGIYQQSKNWYLSTAIDAIKHESKKAVALLEFYRAKFGLIESVEFNNFIKTGEVKKKTRKPKTSPPIPPTAKK